MEQCSGTNTVLPGNLISPLIRPVTVGLLSRLALSIFHSTLEEEGGKCEEHLKTKVQMHPSYRHTRVWTYTCLIDALADTHMPIFEWFRRPSSLLLLVKLLAFGCLGCSGLNTSWQWMYLLLRYLGVQHGNNLWLKIPVKHEKWQENEWDKQFIIPLQSRNWIDSIVSDQTSGTVMEALSSISLSNWDHNEQNEHHSVASIDTIRKMKQLIPDLCSAFYSDFHIHHGENRTRKICWPQCC